MADANLGEVWPDLLALKDPSTRHYHRVWERDSIAGDHPIDAVIRALPEVADADQTAQAAASALAAALGPEHRAAWVRHEDARFEQRSMREERFFDAGFEIGRLAGTGSGGGSPAAFEVSARLTRVLLGAGLRRTEATATLLALPRALLLSGAGSAAQAPGSQSSSEVPVPFSAEEIARLSRLAAAEGASIPEYVRLMVFGPAHGVPEDVTAEREGARIRRERR
jgi:hypothetical protein